MSKQITIRQLNAKKVELTASTHLVHVAFPFTKEFARAFGWPQDLPEVTGTWSPDREFGRVTVNFVEFTPTDLTQAGKRAFRLECHGYMSNFNVVRKQAKGKDAKKAKSKRTDVTATIAFVDEEGTARLDAYMKAVVSSSALISYDPAPVQDEMEGTRESDQEELPGTQVKPEESEAEPTTTSEAPAPRRGRGRPSNASKGLGTVRRSTARR